MNNDQWFKALRKTVAVGENRPLNADDAKKLYRALSSLRWADWQRGVIFGLILATLIYLSKG